MYELPDVPTERWEWLKKAVGDYLLVARTHQSTQSRLQDKSDWLFEGGQIAMQASLDPLSNAKSALWDQLGTGVADFFTTEWPDSVTGLSRKQIGFLSGTYATCFLPARDRDTGEIIEPYGIPNVAKAWAYHGLHVVDGKAPSYQRGEQAGFDRDIKAKLIHRIGGMAYRHDNYYQSIYYRERDKKDNDPNWEDESDGHKHAHALRVVTKEIIKDWWRELHGQPAHAVA